MINPKIMNLLSQYIIPDYDDEVITKIESGIAFYHNHDDLSAWNEFKSILDHNDKNNVVALYFKALIFINRGEYNEVEYALKKLCEITENKIIKAIFLDEYANFLFALKKENKKALELMTEANKLDPKNIEVKLGLAGIYKELDNGEEAIKIYNELLVELEKKDSKRALIYNILGNYYYEMSEIDKAYRYFNKAIDLFDDPEFNEDAKDINIIVSIYRKLSSINCYKQEYDKSIIFAEKVLEKFDDDVEANLNLGICYFHKDELINSRKHFMKIYKYNEYNPIFDVYLGDIESKEENFDKALEYYEIAMKNEFHDMDYLNARVEEVKLKLGK